MQRTERTTAVHHSSLGLHCRGCSDQIFCEYNSVTVGNSGAIWTGAGSLTISGSRRPFRTAYLRFILIELRYSLHSDRYARAAWHVWTSASFYLRVWAQHVQRRSDQSSRYNIWLSKLHKYSHKGLQFSVMSFPVLWFSCHIQNCNLNSEMKKNIDNFFTVLLFRYQ